MSSLSLPSAPSLEQLRKQAKDLLRAHRAGDPQAVARVAAHEPGEPLKLTGACQRSKAATALSVPSRADACSPKARPS